MANISIVLHDLRGGGAEKMMVRLANQLAENGDSVEMILLTGGGVNKPFLSDSVTLIELNAARTLSAFSPLRKRLKQSNPDGILSALTHVNVIASLVCASLGWLKRLSVSERNTFSLDRKVNNGAVMKATYAIAPFIYRFLTNPVIAVSKGVADDLVDCSVVRQKDVCTASNPVITKETLEAAKQDAKHPWLIEKEVKTIVAVGRLSDQKGFDMLIDAFSLVLNERNARLVIFGEGELREDLQNKIEQLDITQSVDLAGYTDNPIAEIKQADLFVLSSRFEGSPNVLVEAMSVGCKVVAFDCPSGPLEILDGGNIAPLVEYKNVPELAKAMLAELATENNQMNRDRILGAVTRFSAQNSAQEYRRLIFSQSNNNSILG
ncbi:glycosyltransferase [Paraglaciecola sp. L1A13]|uniref:glycosyltransferase n=1 Tax=Paraglaciecola sp. L1A13 TaxID=2686359 RepID=UPI00131D9DA8|nr:glycosyltransferase [Paraglaciecola sp. L1A13]